MTLNGGPQFGACLILSKDQGRMMKIKEDKERRKDRGRSRKLRFLSESFLGSFSQHWTFLEFLGGWSLRMDGVSGQGFIFRS